MAYDRLESMLKRDEQFIRELWAWLAIGVSVFLFRFFVRLRMVGPGGLRGDDYVMIVTFIMFCICITMVFLVYDYGTNVDLTAEQINLLSDEEVARVVKGSKFQQVAWYTYTAYLWSLKGGLLLFYKRLTFDMWRHARFLRNLTFFTIFTYLVVVLTITFGCLPYRNNWGVRPRPSEKCVYKAQNLLVTTFFNVITDAAILSLPVPVLKEIRVPMMKKIFIAVLICSGLFVIAAAIMRVAVTLGSERSTLVVNRWGTRECGIGVIATNAPVLRPLFSRRFWQWHYRPPNRNRSVMASARRSRTTVGRRRMFKEASILGWMNSASSRVGTHVGPQPRTSSIDEELGAAIKSQELEPIDVEDDPMIKDAEAYQGPAQA
ncbi:hypothetical protein CCHL11_00819 [Colletotrichum chlorophyti]|uniref:Rhodopsin domain-containing protein n=1 Tax=Colletotrichum chlorophyti TaxID=708187 RepID=A0A1Q8S5H0_9PEZI|nr:hypothetical protein CCHL11_00819 [Colletotrichum chlorophyti]